MRHRLDDVQPMAHGSATSTLREARKVAMTYDERLEPTCINDRPLRRKVRDENARKVEEENAKIQRSSWIFAFASSTLRAFSSRTWRLRGLSFARRFRE